MKFVHVSNVNLGYRFTDSHPWSKQREEEFYEDFRRMLNRCADDNADALFITGNLFAHVPSDEELMKLDVMLLALHNARVFWVFGKNESTKEISRIKNYAWMCDMCVFAGDSLERVFVADWDAEITSVGYNELTWPKVNINAITRGQKASLQILLLPFIGDMHTNDALTGFRSSFDYIGVGHETFFKGSAERRIFSDGMFEPMDFSAQNRHGFFIVNLTAEVGGSSKLSVQFVPNAKREYMVLQVNTDAAASVEDVETKIRSAIRKYGQDNIYRIVLKGKSSPELFIRKEQFMTYGNIVDIDDQTDGILSQAGELSGGNINDALEAFKEALPEDMPEEVLNLALRYGTAALIGTKS